jgi:hypothetical protein
MFVDCCWAAAGLIAAVGVGVAVGWLCVGFFGAGSAD